MELCLGTVQFGMDYGVFNQKKKEKSYCLSCMDYATQNGINAIDTATAYGEAESIVGEFLKKKTVPRDKLFISTKLLPNVLDDVCQEGLVEVIITNIEKSLQILGTDYIDAYYLHSSRYAMREDILEALQEVRKRGLAKNVGVSIYYEEEAEACINNPYVQYVQLPYSVFDHRMKGTGILEKNNNCKVDSRTAFVKGLIRLSEEEVPEYLKKARPILKKLDQVSGESGYSRIELAMGYVKREEGINHLVFGIRDMDQLKEDIEAFHKEIPESIFEELDYLFENVDTDIVVPSLWKR